jgi:hypothetical protein
LSPSYAAEFLTGQLGTAFVALAAVVLAVTGAGAGYADMGHLGRRSITRAWLVPVFPACVLSYLGQDPLILADSHNVSRQRRRDGGDTADVDDHRLGPAAAEDARTHPCQRPEREACVTLCPTRSRTSTNIRVVPDQSAASFSAIRLVRHHFQHRRRSARNATTGTPPDQTYTRIRVAGGPARRARQPLY